MRARMPESTLISRRNALRTTLALALATKVSACGGLGVESYDEAPAASTLELRFVAEGDQTVAMSLPRLGGAEDEVVALEGGVVLRASHIASVQLVLSAHGQRVILLQLNDAGHERAFEATQAGAGRRLAVIADGHVLATPTLRGPLVEPEIAIAVPQPMTNRTYRMMITRAPR